MASATQSSPLLDLAPEIRNHIYRMVLVAEDDVKICSPSHIAMTALLRTCSLIRKEATTIFLGENDFKLFIDGSSHSTRHSVEWLKDLDKNARHVRRLEVDVRKTRLGNRGWRALREDIKILTEALTETVDAGLRLAAVDIDSAFQRGMASRSGYEYNFAEALHDWIEAMLASKALQR